MPISFAQIPANIKVPLYWVEVDPSMAGLPTLRLRALLVGTMTVDGVAEPDVPIAIGTMAQAEEQFGAGSELARMFRTFFANNFANEVWAGPVAEPVGASPASGTIQVAAPPLEAGTIHLYIGGQHVPVNVGGTDTTLQVAAAIVEAIHAKAELPTHDTLPVTAVLGGQAQGIGTAQATVLNITGHAGAPISEGSMITGTGVPAGTTIASQISGTEGGDGSYRTSQVTTATAAALTFSEATGTGNGNGTNLTMTGVTGTIKIGAVITGTGVPAGTTVVSQAAGNVGSDGVYVTSQATTVAAAAVTFGEATGTGDAVASDLNVTAVQEGTIAIGSYVIGTGVPPDTRVVGQVSGVNGKAGVYYLSAATTASDADLTFDLPMDTVHLTCMWAGVNGNDIRVETDYFGQIGGEVAPTGIQLVLPATGFLTGGAGTPEFDVLIMNMGEQEFEYVCMPYTDSTSLMAWEEEYGFGDNGRWGWMRQHFGHVFSSKRGTYSNLINFGLTRNSGVVSIMAFEVKTPTPMFEMAAAYTAKAQRALTNDPARPLQTLQLAHTLPAKLHDRFNWLEINSMAGSGLAIQKCWEGSGMPQIAREQTTYQLNLYGQGDDAYELVTTLATLAKLLRNQRHAITSKYPRHKLANDGTRFGPGQAIVTPGIIKAELISQYRMDEWNGLVEDTRNFKRFLLVERDPNDPNRVNVLYPPDLVNQLRIFAVLAQFRLQYDRGIDVEIIGYTGLSGIAGARGALIGPSL
jgi:phage tail sheath gpL-like